ncbi:MAG: flagellar biosynthesis protein FlhB [Fusobacteria bacterium]|jgi:flagellar biosynthetic protein FlhB|nr:flagellar biosynthesis protein FlhB [Fusobacteriota bacterium]
MNNVNLLNYKINLQIFSADEKTEEATSKKKEEARKKGQVAKSNDLPQVATLIVGIITIKILFSFYYNVLYSNISATLKDSIIDELTFEMLSSIFTKYGIVFLTIAGPVLMAVLIMGLLSNYIQVGFLFSIESIKPNFGKLNPISGIKNMFSMKKLVELLKTLAKLTAIGLYSYKTVKKSFDKVLNIPFVDLMESYIFIFQLCYDMILKIAIVLFVIAVADFFYQKWEHNKSLRMSKQEIKDEFKQSEGDPMIKGKMRQMQRAMLQKKMIQDVPKATVILTNPTHISVALKYERGMGAPVLLAKGADTIAFRIRDIAKENNIPIHENKPLARALYQNVEIGEEIPEEFYQAVAEILMIVMKNN